jgi:hypothetical protein
MIQWAIMRPTTYSERVNANARGKNLGIWEELMRCKSEQFAKQMIRAIEQQTLYLNLRTEECKDVM